MFHLTATLKSLNQQTSKNFHIFVAGTDEPELDPSLTRSFQFIHTPSLAGDDKMSKRADGANKRFTIARHARELGGGYMMFVDSDDLVSRNLVSYVEQNPHPSGYLATDGYLFGSMSGRISPFPFPGYEDYPLDQICGTCAIVYYAPDDLPSFDGEPCAFARIYGAGHRFVRRFAFDEGRPLAKLPFRSVAYVKETEQNLSQSTPVTSGSIFHDELMDRSWEYTVERTPELDAEFGFAAAQIEPQARQPLRAETSGTFRESAGI